jgi:hypothetical protein
VMLARAQSGQRGRPRLWASPWAAWTALSRGGLGVRTRPRWRAARQTPAR